MNKIVDGIGQYLQVGIQVGQDGHMWLKVNNQWKRVVTE